ncbi:MAG TPA: Na+/H+ antiporter NhaA [Longimicrobiaceae bacterium]|nr:Na+/H+ antiporter NhaA [Longimicrobiaceae bacterium]
MESFGGLVLLVAAVVALLWANSQWAGSYHHLWELPIRIGLAGWEFEMTLHHFINDGLMVVFFFLVGLELKREALMGELASPRAAILPIGAAVGGMLVPAALYAALNAGGEGGAGWGIPMATDIAFALGVLALIGSRVPVGVKLFLTALAIIDDLGAVLVIALFYTAELNVTALAAAGVILAGLVAMNRLGVRRPGAYAVVGVALWAAVFTSGIHPTIAGVLLALTIPAQTRIDPDAVLETGRGILDEFGGSGTEGERGPASEDRQSMLQMLKSLCDAGQSPLQRIEQGLHSWVAFGIIPLFALANAGVLLGEGFAQALTHSVTLGVILGLALGKPIGIILFSWLAVRSRLAVLPPATSWRALVGVSFLGGIGFTMSLFIASLAFGEGSALLDAAKVGILAASLIAATAGWILLRGDPSTQAAGSPSPAGDPDMADAAVPWREVSAAGVEARDRIGVLCPGSG